MRRIARLAALPAATLLALGAITSLAGGAQALPPVTVTGSAPATANGGSTITFSYSLALPDALTDPVLTTRQPAALPASVADVTLDGVTLPAADVSRASALDIAVAAGHSLAAGNHVITFQAAVATGPAQSVTAGADLIWTDGAITRTASSPDVPVAVNQPDVAVTLTPDSGEDRIGRLGTGTDIDLSVDVANRGLGTPDTALRITLPTGLEIGGDGVARDDDGTPLTCAASPSNDRIILCALGNLAHAADPVSYDIDLTTSAHPPVGALAAIAATAVVDPAAGTDTDLGNNTAAARVLFTGIAALSYTITPAKARVALGASTAVTLTVHNAGPQPAGGSIALAEVLGDSFRITGFSGKSSESSGPTELTALSSTARGAAHTKAGRVGALAAKIRRLAADPTVTASGSTGDEPSDGLIWFSGDIAAGSSVSAVLTVEAVKLGAGKIGLMAFSDAGDPNCPNGDCDVATAAITAVPVVAVPRPAPTTTVTAPAPVTAGTPVTAAGTGSELANTGTATRPMLGLIALLLLVGAACTALGRRRLS